MPPLPSLKTIECHGTARDMGRQYGEQARDEIRANVRYWVDSGRNPPATAFGASARAVLTARLPQVLAELEGVAEGAGVSVDALLLINHVDTFDQPRPSPGCTSFAVAAGPDGPVLAKNNDGDGPEPGFIIRRTRPAQGLPLIQVTYAGWLSGLDAINGAGLANAHNSVGSGFDKTGPRVDIRLWAYRLMQTCRTAREFAEGFNDAPLTGKGFNIVLADAAGSTVCIEAAVPLVACRDWNRPFVYATNHYVTEPLRNADRRQPEHKWVSIYRHGYLRWLELTQPPSTAADAMAVLRSHAPWAPCRHGGPHLSQTLWSMVALPRDRRLLVAAGPPCTHAYQAIDAS